MSLTHQKTTGTDYTATIAWLSLAFVFGPATLMISEPQPMLLLAVLASSASFVGFAALTWQRRSRLTIPCLREVRAWWR